MHRTLRTERGGEGTAYKKHPQNRKEADLSSQPARNHSHFSFSVAAAVGCARCCLAVCVRQKTRPQGLHTRCMFLYTTPRGTSPPTPCQPRTPTCIITPIHSQHEQLPSLPSLWSPRLLDEGSALDPLQKLPQRRHAGAVGRAHVAGRLGD